MSEEKKETMKTTQYQTNYEPLDRMYPDVYYRCYPYVKQACEMYDNPDNPGFYPYPTRVAVEQMTEYVFQRVDAGDYTQSMDRQYYGGGILRPLIGILVIRELLRRRGPYYYY
ncbi:MAG: hypothetical protein FH756_01940 [Firmicutes bacterium]|nr:hypothetical protein [Bacillota bacterium]